MRSRGRVIVAVILVLVLLPANVIATGRPILPPVYPDLMSYDYKLRVFVDRSIQRENWWVCTTDLETRQRLGYMLVPELVVFGIIIKISSNQTDYSTELLSDFSFVSYIVEVDDTFKIFQSKARAWLLKQDIVPCRFLEVNGKPQVTRAP